jgi:hypothetical protein
VSAPGVVFPAAHPVSGAGACVPRAAVIWLRKRGGINRVDSYDDSLREGLEIVGISVMFLLKRIEMEKNMRGNVP